MAATTTDGNDPSEGDTSISPSDLLLNVIVGLLAPMFLGLSAGDARLARMAALDAVNAYRSQNHADLLAVAQIVGFGLAALGSLSLSMADDVSVSMAIRLRGNANACNRSAQQNRRALTKCQANHQTTSIEPELVQAPAASDVYPTGDGFLSAAAEQQLAAESLARLQSLPIATAVHGSDEDRNQNLWANAMTKESDAITANIPNLPPAQRQAASMRAAMLSSTAHNLIRGALVTPLNPGALAHIARPNAPGNQPR